MRGVFMKKISVFITALLMVCFIIIPTNSVQAIGIDEITRNVEQTNKQIKEEIEKAVYASQKALNNYNEDLKILEEGKDNVINENDKKIEKLEEKYTKEIDGIIYNLLEVTNKMSAKTIEVAAQEGITVYCQWVEVTIGGRTILVDPLRITNE
jgi:formate dehydrogenase maturation protein FdhE